jgi:hypothetical protein
LTCVACIGYIEGRSPGPPSLAFRLLDALTWARAIVVRQWRSYMPMDSHEREVVVDVIDSVRCLANQVLTLHLQIGAVRTILARKGTMTEAELSATLAQLETISTADEILSNDSVDETFDRLLRRIERLEVEEQ